MGLDLADALEEKLIPTVMRSYVLYNILCGIKDLKPSNIGISLDGDKNIIDVRLLDFGLVRKLKVEMSYLVQAMWYRAPEVWLHPGSYGKPVDIWSVGCILGELIGGQVLMRGGTELDLLNHLLLWIPEERLTSADCLKHSYFSNIVEKKGDGEVFSGSLPDVAFEDWNDKTPKFWRSRLKSGYKLFASPSARSQLIDDVEKRKRRAAVQILKGLGSSDSEDPVGSL
ncbi:hypothetical protein RvY_15326 [Ramazzottius varieornatus]|uniref:Protein kinase domain-containing protein n=1 Tax=Ramazzottius varieornatus TaxID=947166 RepID=A0A1D1W1D5_RAMVA|nr:hypothetical protein RvY_15326 [Ramazzottius varieornatus]